MVPVTSQSFTGSASRALHPNNTSFSEVNVHPGSSLHSVGGEDGFEVGIIDRFEGLRDGKRVVVGPDDGTDVGVIE